MSAIIIELAGCAGAEDLLFAQINADFSGIDGYPRTADGGHDPAPIGIGPSPRGFYQSRRGNRAGDLPRFLGVAGLLNLEPYHVLYAFSIRHDLLGQRLADMQER